LRSADSLQGSLRSLALGHVVGDEAKDLAVVVGHGAHVDLHVRQRAVLATGLTLVEKVLFLLHDLLQVPVHAVSVLGTLSKRGS
jgi:hypothetical protein